MDKIREDILLFFSGHPQALPVYEEFEEKLMKRCPETSIRVQKTQIGFSKRHLYACVSFQRVRKKSELPEAYFVLSLGLPRPLDSARVAAKTEPRPGRWTNHIVIGTAEELDEELFSWIDEACAFAESK